MDTCTSFQLEISFLAKFGPEYQNCQFKLKFGTKTNSNMQNWWCSSFPFLTGNTLFKQIWSQKSMVVFIFSVLEWKHPLWANWIPKINCQFKLKFGTKTKSNKQNSMAMLTFSVFDWKHPFWANLVQKFKIVSSIWNLVSRPTQICRIQWWCSLFSVLDRKHPFWANFVQKMKIFTLSWNMVSRLIRICRIQWWCSVFLFEAGNILFSVSLRP